jgi:tetratricopeptide (TPR) repeat protein
MFRDPRAPRADNPRIPRDLETIVLKCLRKDPRDRYATAEALAQDLKRFVRGDPVEARPQSAWEMLGRRAWRNRRRIGAWSLVCLLLLTTGLLVYNQWREGYEAKVSRYEDIVVAAVTDMERGRPVQAGRLEEEASRLAAEDAVGRGDASGAKGDAQTPEPPKPLGALPDPVERAVAELEKAAKLFPERPDAHYHLARAFLKLGKEDEAQAAVARLRGTRPRFVPALVLQATLFERQNRRDQAEETRARARAYQEGAWAQAWLQAIEAEQNRQWKKAVQAYEELLRLDSLHEQPYLGFSISTRLRCGRARLRLGDFHGALEDFAVAHAFWPKLATPLLLSGKTYFLMRERGRADDRFHQLVAQSPAPDEAMLQVASTYLDLEKYALALAWAERAAESPEREFIRTRCFSNLGRYEAMEKAARRGLSLDPSHAMLHTNLGLALHEQYDYEGAEAAYKRAIELDPENVAARHNWGLLMERRGNLQAAIAQYHEAIARGSKHALTYYKLGSAFRRLGRRAEALEQYRKAAQLDPDTALFRRAQARLRMEDSAFVQALSVYRDALACDPDNPSTYDNLNAILLARDHVDLARELPPLVATLETIAGEDSDAAVLALESCAARSAR